VISDIGNNFLPFLAVGKLAHHDFRKINDNRFYYLFVTSNKSSVILRIHVGDR